MSRIRFLADNDVVEAILSGMLRRVPAINICRVRDVGLSQVSDDEVLGFAALHRRVVISHDVNTMRAAAIRRVAATEPFAGLILVPQSSELSAVIDDLVFIDAVTEIEEWQSRIEYVPF